MNTALTWLNDLMTWLGRWVPRLLIVRATHQAVRFGKRGEVVALPPGLHVYWPIVHEVELVSTRQRTMATCSQIHQMEVVGVVITYVVRDAVKLLMTFIDVHANVDQAAQAALSSVYRKELTNDEIAARVRERLTRQFADAGVDILDIGIAQRSWCVPFKSMSDWTYNEEKKL